MARCDVWMLPLLIVLAGTVPGFRLNAQSPASRVLSGIIVDANEETIGNVCVTVRSPSGEQTVLSDENGRFQTRVPEGSLRIHVEGKHIQPLDQLIARNDTTENLVFQVIFVLPPVHDSVV